MNLIYRDGKTFVATTELTDWDRNPTTYTADDLTRLKKLIVELGQFEPLIVTTDGIVLGGKKRLQAFKDLNHPEVWVSVVEPKNTQEMTKYALASNDKFGEYVQKSLTELIQEVAVGMDLDSYHVNLNDSISLTDLLNEPSDTAPSPDTGDKEPSGDVRGKADLKVQAKVICHIPLEKLQQIENQMDIVKDNNSLRDNGQVLMFLLDFYLQV